MSRGTLSRRSLLTAVAACAAFPLLQACASSPTPGATTAPPKPTGAASTPSSSGAASPTAAAKPTIPANPTLTAPRTGEIVIANWHVGTGVPSELAQQKLTEAYQKANPNVKLVWETQVGGDYITWLGTQLAAGTPRPDIVSVNYQPSYNKYVDFIKYKEAINPYTGNKWSQDFDFEFYGSGATQWTFFATQQVQIPWVYNMDLFDKAGITSVPVTYDEWMNACDRILTTTNVAPIAMHFNNLLQWAAEIYFDQYHRDWIDKVRAQPGDWNYNPRKDGQFQYDPTDPDLNKKATFSMQRLLKNLKEGTLSYDDAEMTELMRNWKQLSPFLVKDFWVGVNRYALFLQQQAAMFPDATWVYWTLPKDLTQMDQARRDALKIDPSVQLGAFNYDVFQWPSISSSLVKGKARGIESIAGEYLGAIDKNAEQTALVVDFMMFWMSRAGYQPWVDGFAQSDLWTPSGKLLIREVEIPEKYASVLDSIKPLGNAETAPNGFLTMFGGYGTLWQREAQEMVKGVLDGTVAPEQFGAQYHSLITEKYWSDILAKLNLTEENVANPQLEPKK